jgi:hypothetical protein
MVYLDGASLVFAGWGKKQDTGIYQLGISLFYFRSKFAIDFQAVLQRKPFEK